MRQKNKSAGLKMVLLFLLITFLAQAQVNFDPEMLQTPQKFGTKLVEKFEIVEIGKFDSSKSKNLLLKNGYIKFEITNPNNIKFDTLKYQVKQINVIFSKYPKNIEKWGINYSQLLAKRLTKLFELNHKLNNEKIVWKILMQTDCNNKYEAEKMFHGFEIILKNKQQKITKEQKEILNFIKQQGGFDDSLVLKIFNRNNFRNSLIVMDWTGSMYKYGGQAIYWHMLKMNQNTANNFVLFNDGNTKLTPKKQIGKTGGIYFSKADSITTILNLINEVKENGDGGDEQENDFEAIIKGIEKYPKSEKIILIADNKSCVRDFELIKQINKPVKIILCGVRNNCINRQYIMLAIKTKGSLHTIEHDIKQNMIQSTKNKKIIYQNIEYKIENFNCKTTIHKM